MKHPRSIIVIGALIGLLAGIVVPATADAGYSNGRYPATALSPIFHPRQASSNAPPNQVLAKQGAAPAFNTLNVCLYQQGKQLLYSAGDGAAYRPIDGPGFTQRYAWDVYQRNGWPLAAYPGTSRHGDAAALDLAAPSSMRPLLDSRGPPLRWSWYRTDGSGLGWVNSEDWHVEFHGTFNWPDPGTSPARPDLKLGSGGRCISNTVASVQRRLQALGYFPHHVGGSYNQATRLAVYTFQVARAFKAPTGTVTRNTWLALRQPQKGTPTTDATTHAVAKLSGLKHGDRGTAVSVLSRDLAFVRRHANHAQNFYHGPVLQFFTVGLGGALRAWQLDNGLSATGVYDAQSQKVMGTSVRYWKRKLCIGGTTSPAFCAPPTVAPSGSKLFSDISGNNSSVDLRAYVADRHHIIAIKLTEGDGFRSDSAAGRWKLAGQLAMTRLAYDFARPSQNSCTAEADNFAGYAHQVGWHAGDIAVLDWEDPGFQGRNGDSWVKCWASRLAGEHIRAGVIYSYGDYIANTLTSTHGMGYWHAQYSGSVSSSTAPAFARSHLIAIQFTDGVYGARPHTMPGIGAGDVSTLTAPFAGLTALAQR